MTTQILLMTRPRAASERFVAKLSGDALVDVDVIYAPLMDIVRTETPVNLVGYEGVIFTSGNGVAHGPPAAGGTAYCVGAVTAANAHAAGWVVRAIEQDAEALIARIKELSPKGPLLHLAGRHRRGEIDTRLSEGGVKVDVHVLYDQRLQSLSTVALKALKGEVPIILPLFSARTAGHLAAQIKCAPNVTAVVLSSVIAQAIEGMQPAEVVITAAPTGAEMVRSVEILLHRNRFLEGGVLDR